MDLLLLISVLGAVAAFTLAFGGAARWPQVSAGLRWLALLGAVVAVGRFGWFVWGWLPADSPANSYDFRVFYNAALVAREWGQLYDLSQIDRDPGTIIVYRHVPIGAGLFVPWTFLPYNLALNSWRLLNVGLYAVTLIIFLRHFRLAWREPLALGLVTLWFLSTPSRDSLALGQWDALFLALTLAALILYTTRQDRDWVVGALLALPIALKFYPGLLLLVPFLARRWRVIGGCLIGGLVAVGLGALLAGPRNSWVFVTEVMPAVGGGTLYNENQTLYAWIGRLLATSLPGNGVGAVYPVTLTRLLAGALSLCLLVCSVGLLWRRQRDSELLDALRFGLLMPLALLIIPTAWAHYSAWALLPLALLAVAITRGYRSWTVLLCFALAAPLIVLGSERDVWHGATHDGPIRWILTFKAYGLLALWGGLSLLLWRAQTVSSSPSVSATVR